MATHGFIIAAVDVIGTQCGSEDALTYYNFLSVATYFPLNVDPLEVNFHGASKIVQSHVDTSYCVRCNKKLNIFLIEGPMREFFWVIYVSPLLKDPDSFP